MSVSGLSVEQIDVLLKKRLSYSQFSDLIHVMKMRLSSEDESIEQKQSVQELETLNNKLTITIVNPFTPCKSCPVEMVRVDDDNVKSVLDEYLEIMSKSLLTGSETA